MPYLLIAQSLIEVWKRAAPSLWTLRLPDLIGLTRRTQP